MKNMYKLTDDQVKTFHQKGWIGPLNTFSAQEVEVVRKKMEEISHIELVGKQKIRAFTNAHFENKITQNHHLYYKPLSDLFEDKRIVSRLNQLGEPDLLLWRTNIFHRMPGQEAIGWHQAIDYYGYNPDEPKLDLLFPEGEKPLNLTVWVAFGDITPEMGTMSFANGSHQKRFECIKVPCGKGIFHEVKYAKNYLEAEPEEKRSSKAFELAYDFDEDDWEIESVTEVKAGQIVIFTEHVMHCAPSNNSSKERWAINGRYIRPSVTIHPQLLNNDYIDYFGSDLRQHFCILVSGSNNYKTNKVVTRN